MSHFHYKCVNCGSSFSGEGIRYLCSTCSSLNSPLLPPRGVLKVVYPWNEIRKKDSGTALFNRLASNDFFEILPIKKKESLGNLSVGNTPLIPVSRIDNQQLHYKLFLKDDSRNPTFSFKDRASVLVSAFASENGINTLIAASTGNAGSSLAGICAAKGQKAIICVPQAAPKAKLLQIILYGAHLVPVAGNYDDAFRLSLEISGKWGLYNRNTAFNPLTIEGKKTVSLELFAQTGYQVPDVVFVPVGDGVILSGVYKGFEDLMNLGISSRMPLIVAIQAKGSNCIIRNLNKEDFEASEGKTIADSISVNVPSNFYMAKDYLTRYQGLAIEVSDLEILDASFNLGRNTGIFSEPAGAAAFAGFLRYRNENEIQAGSKLVILLTGSGLKDVQSLLSQAIMPEAINPELSEFEATLKGLGLEN